MMSDNMTTLDELKTEFYGEIGTPERDRFERELEAFRLGHKIRAAREAQDMTQEELAKKIDKNRSFISRIENNGENITLKTLYEVVERGLGGKLEISVTI